jgi:GAF domain-containing protein
MTILHFTVPAEPKNEDLRMEVVRSFGLDGPPLPPDPILDGIVAEAAARFQAPIVLISIVGQNQQCFRSCIGLEVDSTPRSISFCGHAILHAEPMIVNDAEADARFAGNPLVRGPPYIRFYAGAPLITPEQVAIGTLCVIDIRPRSLREPEIAALVALAARVMTRLEETRPR